MNLKRCRSVLGMGMALLLWGPLAALPLRAEGEEPDAAVSERTQPWVAPAASNREVVAAVEQPKAAAAAVGQASATNAERTLSAKAGVQSATGAVLSASNMFPSDVAARTNDVVVDFHRLKALLPETIPGLKRSGLLGERSNAMGGVILAMAEATYDATNGSGGSIHIKISDLATMGGVMANAYVAWSSLEIDRESDTGYEKTYTFGNHKLYEKYDRTERNGEIQALIGDRFLVEVSGKHLDMVDVKNAASRIDLNRLADMLPSASPPLHE